MGKVFHQSLLLIIVIYSLSIDPSEQLQSSQVETLLRIKQLLNFPSVLNTWNSHTEFCSMETNPFATIVCYDENITQLHIIGEKKSLLLPQNFSINSFITTLVKLPDLKVLTLVSLGLWGPLPGKMARLSSLEILNMSSNFLYGGIPPEFSLLNNLQTLILDDDMLVGHVPDWLGLLPVLTVLSLKGNFFNGSLPDSLSSLENLRVLKLSHNRFHGEVPDLRHLKNLQVLELEDNALGPQFPQLANKVVTLTLSKNKFRSSLPPDVSTYYQLQRLDISLNAFVGPFQAALLSLPCLTYLNISENKLTGMLFENITCNGELKIVDLSSNLLTGKLPDCLRTESSRNKDVLYARNCLETRDQNQHPLSFCRNEAFAVGIAPHIKKRRDGSKTGLILSIIGGLFGGIILAFIVFLIVRRTTSNKEAKKHPTKLIYENTSRGYSSKLLTDGRYVSQTMKLGALGLSAYKTFSLEELEEATNNFDSSAFMGEGSHGQMYRGWLRDGSLVAIRCLKMKRSYTTQSLMHHIELFSKLRYRHLVSALGHCFECYLDDSSVSRIFLISEYVPNGNLRCWISEGHLRPSLTWAQRISASIGIAKGIQFLHTGIVPALFPNNLKITDILLDQHFVAQIGGFKLPLLAETMGQVSSAVSSGGSRDSSERAREMNDAQLDVYDLGVILLEIILGRPVKFRDEVEALRDELQVGLSSDDICRRNIVDPVVLKGCSDQSLKTMMEVCVRCLFKDLIEGPSIDDVLWNLQFAAQVQDAWGGEYQSTRDSSVSPSRPPRHSLV